MTHLQLREGSTDLFQMTFPNETSFPVCITALHSEMSIVYYCSDTLFSIHRNFKYLNKFTEAKLSKIFLTEQFSGGPPP